MVLEITGQTSVQLLSNANYSLHQNVVWAIGTGNQVRTVAGDSQATSSFEFSTGYVDGSGQWTYYDADIQPSVQITRRPSIKWLEKS
jgi:hypothetical protein